MPADKEPADPQSFDNQPADPRLRLLCNARREARIVLAVWTVCLIWVVGYSYLRGYQHPPESALVRWGLALPRGAENFRTVAALPDWVFYGIAAPWLLSTLFTIAFALKLMRDDDLGEEPDEPACAGGGERPALGDESGGT